MALHDGGRLSIKPDEFRETVCGPLPRWARREPLPPGPPQPGAQAILSLYAGAWNCRIGVDDARAKLGVRSPYVAAGFVDTNDRLSATVEAEWARRAAQNPECVSQGRIARDVWDLLRARPDSSISRLEAFVRPLPQETLLLMPSGSPCINLTGSGVSRGALGLCGEASSAFWGTPVACWATLRIRPDIYVHVLVENAGSTLEHYQKAFVRALGIPLDRFGSHLVFIDNAKFSACERKRLYVSTLPVGRLGVAPPPPPRPTPWDPGFMTRSDALMGPMMRSRGVPADPPRAVAYQHHPRSLLYTRSCRLRTVPSKDLWGRWVAMLPPETHRAFQLVWSRGYINEDAAAPYVDWVRAHSACGFRVPNAQERARVTGQQVYWNSLGLTEQELYDAVGDYMDPAAVTMRLLYPLRDWVSGEARPRHEFPGPCLLWDLYDELAAGLEGTRFEPVPCPFPPDLLQALMIGGGDEAACALDRAGNGPRVE